MKEAQLEGAWMDESKPVPLAHRTSTTPTSNFGEPAIAVSFALARPGEIFKSSLTSPIQAERTIPTPFKIGRRKEGQMLRRETSNRWTVIAVALGLMLAMSIPAGAASWSEKVTGGGWASAGGADFSLTMSASDVGGQWQYSRTDGVTNIAHGTIDCVFVAEDQSYAVMSGPVTHVDAGTTFVEGHTWTIAVLEGGKGSGDHVRIWSGDHCGAYGGGYPGTYYDGNVNIRVK